MENNGNERRALARVQYSANGIIVVRDTQERAFFQMEDMAPLGLGFCLAPGSPDIQGKDIIIVTETAIMYGDVVRSVKQEDGSYQVGVSLKKFTEQVLQFLFDGLSIKGHE